MEFRAAYRDRAQIDVLVEGEAGLEQDADLEDAGLDVRVTDGAQEGRRLTGPRGSDQIRGQT
jgi:hypothetical protein